jgi:hypothetical protein
MRKTAEAGPAVELGILQLNAACYFVKPFDPEILPSRPSVEVR